MPCIGACRAVWVPQQDLATLHLAFDVQLWESCILSLHCTLSLDPRLSPHANEKSKERGELGKIYHMRNVIGRENLITCGRTNELAHAVWTDTVVQLR